LLRGRGKEVNLNAIENASFSYKSADRSMYTSRVNTVMSTVLFVHDIIEQQERIELLEREETIMRGHAETAKIKKNVGLATAMDAYRAMIRLKDVQDNLSMAQNDLSKVKDSLKKILALPLELSIEVDAPLDYDVAPITLDDAIKTALENRIEMEHAMDFLKEAERKSRVAKHNLLPRVDCVIGYRKFTEDFALGDSNDNFAEDEWRINLVGTTDWSRTNEKLSFRQSLLNIKNAELTIQSQRDEIISEVRNQIEVLENWKKRILIRKDQIREAIGKQKLSEIKFDHGMANNFDLIEAESELYRARTNLLSVETEYRVNHYQLLAVLGVLIDRKGELNLDMVAKKSIQQSGTIGSRSEAQIPPFKY